LGTVPLTSSQQAINLLKEVYPKALPRELNGYMASSITFNLVMNYIKKAPSFQELIRIKEKSGFDQFKDTIRDKIREFRISSRKDLQYAKQEIEKSINKDLRVLEKEWGVLKKYYTISMGTLSIAVISSFLLPQLTAILTAQSATILSHTLLTNCEFKKHLENN
jgi:hypothetical protein